MMIKNAAAVLQHRSYLTITEPTDVASITATVSLSCSLLEVRPHVAILQVNPALTCEPFHVDAELSTISEITCKPFTGWQIDFDALRSPWQILSNYQLFIDDEKSFYGTGSFWAGTPGVDSLLISRAKPEFFETSEALSYGTGTVEFWYRPEQLTTGENPIFDIDNFFTELRITEKTDGSIYLTARFGANTLNSEPYFLAQGTWNHIAVTLRDGVYADLYVNGQRFDTIGNGTDVFVFSSDADSKWRLGYGSNEGFFNGLHISKTVRYTGESYAMPTNGGTSDANTYYFATLETYEPETSFFVGSDTLTFTATDNFLIGAENNKLPTLEQEVYEFTSPTTLSVSDVSLNETNDKVTITFSNDFLEPGGGDVKLYYTFGDEYIEQLDQHSVVLTSNTMTLDVTEALAFGHKIYVTLDEGVVKDLNFGQDEVTANTFFIYAYEKLNSVFSMAADALKLWIVDPLAYTATFTQETAFSNRRTQAWDTTGSGAIATVISDGNYKPHIGFRAAPSAAFSVSCDALEGEGIGGGGYIMNPVFTIDAAINAERNAIAGLTTTSTVDAIIGAIYPEDIDDLATTSTVDAIIGAIYPEDIDDLATTATLSCTATNIGLRFIIDTNNDLTRNIGMSFVNFEDLQVDWGDDIVNSESTHTYATNGTYQITVQAGTNLTGNRQFKFTDNVSKLEQVLDWKDSEVNSFNAAFETAQNLTTVPDEIPSTLTDISQMFKGVTIRSGIVSPMNSWNTINVTNMNELFRDTTGSGVTSLSSWNTSYVTNMGGMFRNAWDIPTGIGSWDTSSVTDFSHMFDDYVGTITDITSWNTTSADDMSYMFSGTSFNQNISSWDVTSVTNMSYMFSGAQSFDQPIGTWNTISCTDMSYMFARVWDGSNPAMSNSINGWNTSSVTNMKGMFYNHAFYNQPLGSWNTANVTDMSYMFYHTTYNQPLNTWNTGNVTNMEHMFNLTAFNQPLSSWNTSKVTRMVSMFASSNMDQNISGWDVSLVTAYTNFDYNTPATWTYLEKPNFI